MSNQPVSVPGSPAASVQDKVDMITPRGNSSNTMNNNNEASQEHLFSSFQRRIVVCVCVSTIEA
jgi:hypothetical protein